MSEDNLFYIVSPKDVVVARQRDQDDHIAWLLQHERYEVQCRFMIHCPNFRGCNLSFSICLKMTKLDINHFEFSIFLKVSGN